MPYYVNDNISTDIQFEALPMEDFHAYNEHLLLLPHNAMYKKELLLNSIENVAREELWYFMLSLKSKVLILMPFIKREIHIGEKKTSYYDVCSPYGFSGPLYGRDLHRNYLHIFWNKIDEWYVENKIIAEFIRFNLQKNWLGYSGNLIPSLKTVSGTIISKENQWCNFKPKVRNNFRTAVRNKLEFKIYCGNITDHIINQFYDIYISTMKRKNADKKYYYQLDNIRNFIRNNPEDCAIGTIYHTNTPISTELLIFSNTEVLSFLGGTVEKYFYARPNDFLKVNIINWIRDQGYQFYLLGGGRKNDDSLYKYKRQFFPNDPDRIFFTGRKVIDENIYSSLVKIKNKTFSLTKYTKGMFPEYLHY